MSDQNYPDIGSEREQLLKQAQSLENKRDILKSELFVDLVAKIPKLEVEKRANYGRQVNLLRQELLSLASDSDQEDSGALFDVTAPMGVNQTSDKVKRLLPTSLGSVHPLMSELDRVLDIFYRMGFSAVESPEIDDDYHMFGSLNFPEDHPSRDDFDTFMTKQLDSTNKPLVAPAHTSTMQSRVLKENAEKLKAGMPIACVIPGRVFRNEDLDPRHEHTFYQIEGIYVGKGVNVGNLMSTLKDFLAEYFNSDIELKTQPFYFPFTEPSFEFSIKCIFCKGNGCNICSYGGWIELLGCGMTHPNVYREAGIDPEIYTGFAFGIGFMRMAMIKFGIEDVRYFLSGRLDFLRQF